LKTPISYYGGKQQLIPFILPLIPKHKVYVEAFCGGAALLFAKEAPTARHETEMLNDTSTEVTNFFQQARDNFAALDAMIKSTVYSRVEYKRSSVIYQNADCFTPLERAWAFWVTTNMAYAHMAGGSWAYDRSGQTVKKIVNKKTAFDYMIKERLKYVQIEHKDALLVIKHMDTPDTFLFLDPPYPNSAQGHYGGYEMEHFQMLLDLLEGVQGKFLLTSYDYPELTAAAKKNGWFQIKKTMPLAISKPDANGKKKTKTEVFTANYDLQNVPK
jgi:DNA adenine methylase